MICARSMGHGGVQGFRVQELDGVWILLFCNLNGALGGFRFWGFGDSGILRLSKLGAHGWGLGLRERVYVIYYTSGLCRQFVLNPKP